MKKRIISILLTISMLFSILPVSIFATNSTQPTINKYIVAFNANGEDVINMPETQLVEEGKNVSMPYNPSRDGYVFLGWYLNPEETNLTQKFNFVETPIYDNMILYAMWGDSGKDIDNDGLPDDIEEQIGTNIALADTDGDGLSDYLEVITLSTDPLHVDTDNNGISDGEEDYDGDFISNIDEIAIGTNPGNADSDFDGLSDNDELTIGSDPTNKDTDGDGAFDGVEVRHNYDPLISNDSFVDVATSQPISADFHVSASVKAEVPASVLDTVVVNPLNMADNPLISSTIPGYLGNAFELSANGEIYSAVLTFEYDTTLWSLDGTFQPRVYQFNETTQALDELDNQTIAEGFVSVPVESCGTYILINKYDYEFLATASEVSTFSKARSRAVATSASSSYEEYYASYVDELKAIASNSDTTDANQDGILDKYNMPIFLGLVPTVTGANTFVGYDFSTSNSSNPADYDGDGLINGDEIEIVIVNGLPRIKVNSYPMLEDSDFDGWTDAEEQEGIRLYDPMRHSYPSNIIKNLLDDDQYSAAIMVGEIETNEDKYISQYILTCLGYLDYGSVDEIFATEWLTYIKDYYDNTTGANSTLMNSTNKYLREYWLETGYVVWETTGKCCLNEMQKSGIQTIVGTYTEFISPKYSEMVNLREAANVSRFHLEGNLDDNFSSELADRIDSIQKKISQYDDTIAEMEVKLKHADHIGTAIEVVNVLVNIEGEISKINEAYELVAEINANFEAYVSSKEIFYYISQNSPIDKAAEAAAMLYLSFDEQHNEFRDTYFVQIESGVTKRLSVGMLFEIAEDFVETVIKIKKCSVASFALDLIKSVGTTVGYQNNIIIADDIFCDAVEVLMLQELERIGESYSPITQERKPIADRYIANLIQLRMLGEMNYNRYVYRSQSNYDAQIERLKGYAEDLNLPISNNLLLQCALTTTHNVKFNIENSPYQLTDPLPDSSAGDNSSYYWLSIDGYTTNHTHNAYTITGVNLNSGKHVLTVGCSSRKACNYYLDIEEGQTYNLTFTLVPDLSINRTITGYSRRSDLGSTLGNVTVKFREGLNNKNGDVITTVTTDDNGKYSTTLPNGYYTAEFSKSGYDSGYTNLVVYKNEHDCSGGILESAPTQTYYIVYDANGGSGAPNKQVNTGNTVLSSSKPTKDGYRFLGWATTPTASTEEFKAGSTCTKTGNVILYAVWEKVDTIIYKANGGEASSVPSPHENTVGATTLSSVEPKRTGYHFRGWGETADQNDNETLYLAGATYSKDGDVTLYAHWEAGTFDIIFDAKGGIFQNAGKDTITLQKTYLQPFTISLEKPVMEGHVFSGYWTINKDGSGRQYIHGDTFTDIGGSGLSAKTLYAQWIEVEEVKTEAEFTYDYNYNRLTKVNVLPLTNGSTTVTLIDPPQNIIDLRAVEGCKFVCWRLWKTDGSSYTHYNSGDTITISDDTTVYAVWTDPAAGTILTVLPDKGSYKPGDTVLLSITADNSGYFTVDASATNGFKVKGADGSSTGSAVFVENSSESTANTLKCYDNGSAYTVKITIPNNCSDGLYEVEVFASNGTYNVSGTETSTASETVTIKVDTAEEEAEKYVLTYDLNGGTGDIPDTITFEKGEKVTLADDGSSRDPNFWREGYVFLGWTEDKAGKEDLYDGNSRVKFNSNVILYAQWEKEEDYGKLNMQVSTIIDAIGGYTVYAFRPGTSFPISIECDYSDHFFVDARNCPGFTMTTADGKTNDCGTWFEKDSLSSANDGTRTTYTDGKEFRISITIPKNCPDGMYTIAVTASNGVMNESNKSDGDKILSYINIYVRSDDYAEGIALNYETRTIHVGDERTVVATLLPNIFSTKGNSSIYKNIKWTTDNKNVVSIDSYRGEVDITGLRSGTATVTASMDGVSASCTVTVVRCDYSEKIVDPDYLASPATCSSQATYYYVCSCGDVSSSTYKVGELADHNYSAWTTVTEPTETNAGLEQRVCNVCQHSEEKAIPALGGHTVHTPSSQWSYDATNHWKVCSYDSCTEKLETAKHIFGDLRVEVPASETHTGVGYRACTVCGYEKSEIIPVVEHEHTWGSVYKKDTTHHWYECPGCEEKKDYAEHTWNSGEELVAATEDSIGLMLYTCTACEQTKVEIIPALGHAHNWDTNWSKDDNTHWHQCFGCSVKQDEAVHTWNDGEITTPATESTEGTKTYTCTVCGQTKTEKVPAIGHQHSWATTWSNDETHHWHICDGCDEVNAKAEHTWNEGEVTIPATETTEGTKTYTCTVCSKEKTEKIPVIGHQHNWTSTWSSNETHHWHICDGCDEVTAKAEHTWNDGEVTTPATETTEGIKTYTCAICGKEKTEKIPTTGIQHNTESNWTNDVIYHWHECSCGAEHDKSEHIVSDWIVDVEATATTNGSRHKECTICEYVILTEVIPATGSDFDWEYWYWIQMMIRNQEFTIEATANEGGTITSTSGDSKVKYDNSLTYKITPDEGYEIVSVFVDGKDIGAVTEYTFKNVKKAHTISAVFAKLPWQNPFIDIFESDWFYADIQFVNEEGLMIGTDLVNGKFSPHETLNRATIVTTLWRLAGSPIVELDTDFTDLPDDWYTDAMKWAIANKIILGYGDGTCRPMTEITHEQVIAILHRFMVSRGYEDKPTTLSTQFIHSEWAENNVLWAITNNLFDGFGSDVSDLTKTANRAEIAAYLRRLCELIEQ